MEEETFNRTAKGIINISIILSVTITFLALVVNLIDFNTFKFSNYWYEWPASYLLGAVANIINFIILKRSLSNPNYIPKTSVTSNKYLLRMGIYVAACYIALKIDRLNVIPVFLGFFTVRIAIYIYTYKNRG